MPKTLQLDTTSDTDLCCPTDEVVLVDQAPLDSPESDVELAMLAKALSHPTRVRIVRMLARREARMCSQIVDEFPAAQSTVSEHLRVLKAAGLIVGREDGPRIGYCIAPPALRRLKALVGAL
ncbi:MAG: winged helix-turn-helix domain-containing protein [Acidobacteria bacterium]|nr:winged helix-turn-helix domain-containing protein [Acidobacteriota bacterium]